MKMTSVIVSSLCNLCVLCVSVVKKMQQTPPQRHRERRGCTEKKIRTHLRSTVILIGLRRHRALEPSLTEKSAEAYSFVVINPS